MVLIYIISIGAALIALTVAALAAAVCHMSNARQAGVRPGSFRWGRQSTASVSTLPVASVLPPPPVADMSFHLQK